MNKRSQRSVSRDTVATATHSVTLWNRFYDAVIEKVNNRGIKLQLKTVNHAILQRLIWFAALNSMLIQVQFLGISYNGAVLYSAIRDGVAS